MIIRFHNVTPQRRAYLLTTALICLSACPFASAFSPRLDLISPCGGQRGTEVDVRFDGDRLDGLQDALFYESGLTLRVTDARDPKHAVAKLVIAPDARLGEHSLRLHTPGGLTELRTFWVGQYPTVMEQEPNNTFDQAQRITPGVTVQGVAGNEDEDYFVCSLKKGDQLSVEAEAMRLGRVMFDAYVAILGPNRFELATCDDCALLKTDPYASIIAPADGDYRIVIREAAYEGNAQCQYRLHIGPFPRPSAVFPPAGKPGETLEFTFLGDPAGPLKQSITLPASPARVFPVFATRGNMSAPSPNWISISPLESVREAEPNDDPDHATPLSALPCAAHGIIQKPGDEDWYKFHAAKGENLVVRVIARALRSPLDSQLFLHGPDRSRMLENDDQGGPDSLLSFAVPADGDYYLRIRDQLGHGGPDFVYLLEIVRRDPSVSATLPVAERNNSQKAKTFPVPKGNRYAAVINVARENTVCDLAVEAPSLPAGVVMNAPPVPRSLNAFPVVFEAAPDAAVSGGLYDLFVKSVGNVPPLRAAVRDVISHIEVNNEGSYHSTALDRMAMAVTEEAPFHIDLETPAVPLVKGGVASLKVRASRKDGYNEPITLRIPWSPPGVSGPGTVTIPPGQTDALYELNANNDSAVGDWQICLAADADTPKGPVSVATSLVPLRVADPYVSLSIEMAAAEQGKPTRVVCKLDVSHDFAGAATAELIGLPHGAKTNPVTFTKEQREIVFPVEVAPDATPGKHNSLFCKISIPENNHVILHQLGQGGTLRIDKPLPAQVAQPTASPAPKPAVTPAGNQPKPLSHLEQLRQRANP